MNKEEFYRKFPEKRLTQQDIDAVNIAGLEEAFNQAYHLAMQHPGRTHEEAVQLAQQVVHGKVLSEKVGPQSEILAEVARRPSPQSAAHAEAVAQNLSQARIPTDRIGRRMAMRYGIPSLGVVLGLYGLEALQDDNQALPKTY